MASLPARARRADETFSEAMSDGMEAEKAQL
jgi:hypothetical protein